jgi:hypothetical protein
VPPIEWTTLFREFITLLVVIDPIGSLRWSGLFGQLFGQLSWNPAVDG